ncbi:alpha/beta hydrolase [Novosphingobium sp.]|uniref:alpha/beta fold hydrolase n=1 Tax=Novosphingobium sp. TaxID=1874826 RepID=UPI002603B81F|nr:alpha/beta hydrolase [Novosphingobium sp.]
MAQILAAAAATMAVLAGGLALYSFAAGRIAERRVPPLGRFLDLRGARLHYLTMGTGPAVVLVHGLTGQLRDFTYALAEQLAADHRVILFDRPGSGHSAWRRRGDRGIAAHAAILREFLQVLGLERPLVVGHSLGGAVALKLAIDHPDAVGGLGLICPLTQPVEEAPPMFRALMIESDAKRWLLSHTLAVPVGKLRRGEIARMLFAPDAVPADYGLGGGALLKDRASVFRTASREVLSVQAEMPGIAEDSGTIGVPVAILFGRGDGVLDPSVHGERTAAGLQHGSLTLVDGGHMIPATRPEAVAAWLRGVAQTANGPE